MNFHALVVKNDDPMTGHRIYFSAANIDDALIEADWQLPIGYHVAWVDTHKDDAS